ncbi:hypothetical protein CKY20_06795 [Capnocytophaga canis]|uniref:Uncharacterized protein n=1 Tax=Capnocytophaga canis TaxID=1848903 RepID=A0A3A1YG37_9FLAO|nr:NVEALA domain-containing protein [Capnocytophaga canis]RIY36635.1 hypothetical protein CKY20_06795 [Capnocytophaga canis]
MKSLLVIGIVAVGGYGISESVNKDTAELNELILANLEALAQSENGEEDDSDTPPKECYRKYQLSPGIFGQHSLTRFITCDGCKYVRGYNTQTNNYLSLISKRS